MEDTDDMSTPRLDERGVEAAARAVRAKLPPGAQFGPTLNVLDAITFSEVAVAAYFAALDRADIHGGAVHLDVCPYCRETNTSHMLDAPNFCRHEYERRVPVLFVPVDNLTALGFPTPDTEEQT